jgi:MFS family permease
MRVLLIAGFFMSASQSLSSIAVPITLLQAGAGAAGVGTVMALMNLAGMIELLVVGAYADRGLLRFFLIAFPFTSLIGVVPFFLSSSVLLLGAGTVIGGFGGGSGTTSGGTGPYQPAEYGWIAHNYPATARNRLVSSFSARDVAGVILASAVTLVSAPLAHLAGFGRSESGQARLLMLLVAVFAAVPTVLGCFVRAPNRRAGRRTKAERSGRPHHRLARFLWPRNSGRLLLQLTITNSLNGIAVGTYASFLTTWLILEFNASPGRLGLLNLIISVTAIIGDLACPAIASRVGLVRSVLVTRSIQALMIIPIALSPSLAVAQVLLVIRQFAQRLNTPLRDSYTLARADPNERARMSAMSNVGADGMQSVSNQVMGQVIARLGFVGPFIFASLCQFASGLLFFGFFAKRPPPEETGHDTEAVSPASGELAAAVTDE